jgi:hypothetical protein
MKHTNPLTGQLLNRKNLSPSILRSTYRTNMSHAKLRWYITDFQTINLRRKCIYTSFSSHLSAFLVPGPVCPVVVIQPQALLSPLLKVIAYKQSFG